MSHIAQLAAINHLHDLFESSDLWLYSAEYALYSGCAAFEEFSSLLSAGGDLLCEFSQYDPCELCELDLSGLSDSVEFYIFRIKAMRDRMMPVLQRLFSEEMF